MRKEDGEGTGSMQQQHEAQEEGLEHDPAVAEPKCTFE